MNKNSKDFDVQGSHYLPSNRQKEIFYPDPLLQEMTVLGVSRTLNLFIF